MKLYVKSILVSLVIAGIVAFTSQAAVAQKSNLIFYSSLTTAAQATLVKGIEKKFPDIKVQSITAGGVSLYQRFVAERSAWARAKSICFTSATRRAGTTSPKGAG